MIVNIEFVIKKGDEFHGIPYSILENGRERWGGSKCREAYETDEYEILSKAEYDKKVEAFCVEFCGKWKESTEQRYNEMLNILPPLKWTRGGFFISEAYTLDIHPFHQKFMVGDSIGYYEAYFRINTPRDEILQSLSRFVKAQREKEA